MRKVLALMAFASIALFVACEEGDDNDDDSGTTPATEQDIIGIWNTDSTTFKTYLNSNIIDTLTEVEVFTNQTIEFELGGNAYLDSAGIRLDTISWSLVDSVTLEVDSVNWSILSIDPATHFTVGQDSSANLLGLPVDIETRFYMTK